LNPFRRLRIGSRSALQANAVVSYDNPLDNVVDMAHHFFKRCLASGDGRPPPLRTPNPLRTHLGVG